MAVESASRSAAPLPGLCLRGKWLHLVSVREVLALCDTSGMAQGYCSHSSAEAGGGNGAIDAEGDRVIVLR